MYIFKTQDSDGVLMVSVDKAKVDIYWKDIWETELGTCAKCGKLKKIKKCNIEIEEI